MNPLRREVEHLGAPQTRGKCRNHKRLEPFAAHRIKESVDVLWLRCSVLVRREFRWSDEARWIERYGRVERITRKERDEVLEGGASSRRKAYRTTVQENPVSLRWFCFT